MNENQNKPQTEPEAKPNTDLKIIHAGEEYLVKSHRRELWMTAQEYDFAKDITLTPEVEATFIHYRDQAKLGRPQLYCSMLERVVTEQFVLEKDGVEITVKRIKQ
jgi:hypothetical protein